MSMTIALFLLNASVITYVACCARGCTPAAACHCSASVSPARTVLVPTLSARMRSRDACCPPSACAHHASTTALVRSTLFIAFVLRMGYEKAPAVLAKLQQMRSGGDGGVASAMEIEIAKIRRHSGSNAAAAEIASRRLSATFDEIAALTREVAELKEQNAACGAGAGGSETSNPLRKERRATSSRRAGVSKRDSSRSSESRGHDPAPRGSIVVPIVGLLEPLASPRGRLEPLASPSTGLRCVLHFFCLHILFCSLFFCLPSLFSTSATAKDGNPSRSRRASRTAERRRSRVDSAVKGNSSDEGPSTTGARSRGATRRRSSRASNAIGDVSVGAEDGSGAPDAAVGRRRGSRRAGRVDSRRSSLASVAKADEDTANAPGSEATPPARPRRASRSARGAAARSAGTARVLLFTVIFYAIHAHNLTRSP